MLSKNALLVVSNPKQIGKILPSVRGQVKNTLYIQLLSALGEPFGSFHTNIFTSWPKYSKTIYSIYSQAATHCQNLDVRVLLSGLKHANLSKIQTSRNVDLVIFDRPHSETDIDNFIRLKVNNIAEKYNVLTLDTGKLEAFDTCWGMEDGKVHTHAVLGGTFDRLHIAHKVLLTEACLRASEKVTVGITERNMLKNKILWELCEDLETRMANLKDFLQDVCGELKFAITPITDPFGPAVEDPTMKMIVVSDETTRGADKINEIRKSKGLCLLDVVKVPLVEEPMRADFEEMKISSSTGRIRILGNLLKPVNNNKPYLPRKPYVIGLTGGVASGKSGVAKWLSQHGAQIINCDLIGHEIYKPGRPCHKKIVDHFGQRVLTSEGEINRKVLGSIVFENPAELEMLNSLVWPSIAEEVMAIIKKSTANVVVVEAAVLIKANWDKFCHEVWVTLVPPEEAVTRLKSRNGLSEEQALLRLKAQPSNVEYVALANVVFCPFWDELFTKRQVDKAWALLQQRLL